jgi:hypothetical protein
MFVVGSVTGYNACNALWSIFDMVTLEWIPYFDPNAQYEVPLLISDIIGGEYVLPIPGFLPNLSVLNRISHSATGGATKKVPVNGWSSKEVEAVFSPSSKSGPNKDGSSNVNSDKAITLTPSKIAGVSVGGVLFLAMVVGLFFVLRHRKNRSRRAMEIPPVAPYGELPAFGGLFLDKAELPAALVHELPNSVPVPPQRG